MATKYPDGIDNTTSLPYITNGTSPMVAEDINRLRDAVVAVETELGVDPSGTFTSVGTRLQASEQAISGYAQSQFLVLSHDGYISQERVFAPSSNFSTFDGGAGSDYSIDLADTVGIGTLSPNAAYSLTLDGNGTTRVGGLALRQSGASTFFIGSPDPSNAFDIQLLNPNAGYVSFGTNNTERLRILSTGRVGIGTTTPESTLHVVGDSGLKIQTTGNPWAVFGADAAASNYLKLERPGSTDALGYIGGGAGGSISGGSQYDLAIRSEGSLYFASNGNIPRMVVDATGNVGIGTTSPLTRLHIDGNAILSGSVGVGTSSPAAKLHVSSDTAAWAAWEAATGGGSFMSFKRGGTGDNVGYLGTDGGGILGAGTTPGGSNFGIRAENDLILMSGASEAARLTASGFLGIGTSSPSASLDVRGSLYLGSGSTDFEAYLRSKNNTLGKISSSAGVSGVYNGLRIDSNYNQVVAGLSNWFVDLGGYDNITRPGTSDTFNIGRRASGSSDTTLFIIKSNGNAGLGTTNPSAKLDVNNGIIAATGDSGLPTSHVGGGLALGNSSAGGYKWIQSFDTQPLHINPLGNLIELGGQADFLSDVNIAGRLNIDDGTIAVIGDSGLPTSYVGGGLVLGNSSVGGYKWIQSFDMQPLRINPLGNQIELGGQVDFASNVDIAGSAVISGTASINGLPHNESTVSDGFVYFSPQKYLEAGTSAPGTLFISQSGDFTVVTAGSGGVPASTAIPFTKVVQHDQYSELRSDFIPVQAGETICGEIWAARPLGATGTAGEFFLGLCRFDKDKLPIAANTGIEYFPGASSITIPNDGVWRKYGGSITLPLTHTPNNGSDGAAVRYVQVIILSNYNSGTIRTFWGGALVRRLNLSRDARDVAIQGRVDMPAGLRLGAPASDELSPLLAVKHQQGAYTHVFSSSYYQDAEALRIYTNAQDLDINDAVKLEIVAGANVTGVSKEWDFDVPDTEPGRSAMRLSMSAVDFSLQAHTNGAGYPWQNWERVVFQAGYSQININSNVILNADGGIGRQTTGPLSIGNDANVTSITIGTANSTAGVSIGRLGGGVNEIKGKTIIGSSNLSSIGIDRSGAYEHMAMPGMIKRRSADLSRQNVGPVPDTELPFSLPGGTYLIRACFFYSNTTASSLMRIGISAAISTFKAVIATTDFDGSSVTGQYLGAPAGSSVLYTNLPHALGNPYSKWEGVVTLQANSPLSISWGQSTIGPNPVTLREGSYVELIKLEFSA